MSFKNALSTILVVVLTIFIVQNFALVTVSFLFWEASLPRSIVLLVVFVIGLLTGILISQRPSPDDPS